MSKERILVVDDESDIRKMIKRALEMENMVVSLACGGNEAIATLKSSSFDLIVLDVMMNDMDGFEVVKHLRNAGVDIPIFLLSGKDEDYNKILGLGLGADDYITKPFSPAVLCAKIKAQIRRCQAGWSDKNNIIMAGPFRFDCNTYKLYKNEIEIHLSSKEIVLMKFFLMNQNQVFTKEQLYQNVWGDIIVDDKTIMVYICHLRNKIEADPQNPKYIKTVWGIGYIFSIDTH
jgi:DNA-binding response OmpR family regulator